MLLKRTIETSATGTELSLDVLSAAQETVEDTRTLDPEESTSKKPILLA